MIDWMKLARSVDFYEKSGFARMEAPWWTSKEILDITTPKEVNAVYHLAANNKCLVASAEQGFLYIATKGRLPKGRFQSITPCFRDESIGILHRKCFMKNELIDTDDVNEASLHVMIETAREFFASYIDEQMLAVLQTGAQSYDITYDGIELGSYGIRECEFLKWVYGTGCAEPRLTRAMKTINYRKRRT